MAATTGPAPLPPRAFIRVAWIGHRVLCRLSRCRRGLWVPDGERWGAMRLHTTGRRSGRERVAILAYREDGPNLVTMAMNGWADPEPAWWLNLLAHPEATVDLVGGSRAVRGRAATGEERDRLLVPWVAAKPRYDAYAARRTRPTQVVVLEPRAA